MKYLILGLILASNIAMGADKIVEEPSRDDIITLEADSNTRAHSVHLVIRCYQVPDVGYGPVHCIDEYFIKPYQI